MKFPVVIRSSDRIINTNNPNSYSVMLYLPSNLSMFRYLKAKMIGFLLPYNNDGINPPTLTAYDASYIDIRIDFPKTASYDTINHSQTASVGFATVQDTSLERCVFRISHNYEFYIPNFGSAIQLKVELMGYGTATRAANIEGTLLRDETGAVPSNHTIIFEFEGMDDLPKGNY